MKPIDHFSPLPKSVTIGKSKIHGLGLIATDDIAEKVDLGISHVINECYKDGLIRTPLGGFINHSDTPNAKLEIDSGEVRLITQKPVRQGEEVTVDYHGWYSDEAIGAFK